MLYMIDELLRTCYCAGQHCVKMLVVPATVTSEVSSLPHALEHDLSHRHHYFIWAAYGLDHRRLRTLRQRNIYAVCGLDHRRLRTQMVPRCGLVARWYGGVVATWCGGKLVWWCGNNCVIVLIFLHRPHVYKKTNTTTQAH